MNTPVALSVDVLETRRRNALRWSEKAIQRHPETYAAIRKMLHRILCASMDVSEYYPVATELSGLIRELSQNGDETIFQYYYPHIDPGQSGDPRYFRAMCLDLYEQMQELDSWRISHRHLRLVRRKNLPGCQASRF